MRCREPRGTRLLFRPNPDRACASDERKWIVTDEFCRPFQLELDGVVRKRTNGAKFIGHAENDPG